MISATVIEMLSVTLLSSKTDSTGLSLFSITHAAVSPSAFIMLYASANKQYHLFLEDYSISLSKKRNAICILKTIFY